MKASRLAAVATAEEKYRDPAQPPIDKIAFTFWGIVSDGRGGMRIGVHCHEQPSRTEEAALDQKLRDRER